MQNYIKDEGKLNKVQERGGLKM